MIYRYLFCYNLCYVNANLTCFFHVLNAYIFLFGMDAHFTCKDIRTRQSHKRQTGTVRAATDADAFWRNAGTFISHFGIFHNFRMQV